MLVGWLVDSSSPAEGAVSRFVVVFSFRFFWFWVSSFSRLTTGDDDDDDDDDDDNDDNFQSRPRGSEGIRGDPI